MTKNTARPGPKANPVRAAREARLAKALRANLKRRNAAAPGDTSTAVPKDAPRKP